MNIDTQVNEAAATAVKPPENIEPKRQVPSWFGQPSRQQREEIAQRQSNILRNQVAAFGGVDFAVARVLNPDARSYQSQ